VTPTTPEVGQIVTFDASGTTDEGAACRDRCTYSWGFDDGTTGSGRVTTHAFSTARSYNVALTVADPAGSVVTTRQLVAVSAVTAPSVSLSVSPNPPVVDQQATFTATATPSTGHSIVRYDWNFGDGNSVSTTVPTVTRTFTTNTTRTVTVTATDDRGQTGNATLSVTPGFGPAAPAAVATVSPSTAQPRGTVLAFDASGSTTGNGATITEYTWIWGDNTSNTVTSSSQTTHTYATTLPAGTYIVRLIVRDNLGRTATTTLSVTVT
jgi:PKD repeat protein